jgi:GAF domain-containing protein/HAMP domain-containing protein
MNRRSRFLPLRAKLALGFALLFMAASGLTTYIYYQNARAQLQHDIRERLRDAVSIGALQVDAVAHSQLTDPSQEGGPVYLPLKKALQQVRDAGTNIRFVYTMQQDAQGNIIFVVDAEETEEDVSHLGDIYDDASPWLSANFASIQAPVVEDEMYTDKWGTWLTGYAPFYAPDGRREGLLGMDISADYVLAQERKVLAQALLTFFGAIIGGSIVGWILGNTLTRSISKLTEGAEILASGNLAHRVQIKTHDEVEILADAFNSTAGKLSGLVTGLEQRVEERTTALSRRTSQLQAATQVARQAAAIKDTTTLLNEAVRLISDQFDFYHAGIFLLDQNNEYAILQAASSEGGQKMLERGHRLQVGGQGIVGYAAAQKRPRIALDTGTDAHYFDNPDLPLTHSEAALPLIVRDRVIGVLDIQSDKANAFTQDDLDTFQTLADQLALAIDNARLFGETNTALRAMEQITTEHARQIWTETLDRQDLAYVYTPLGTSHSSVHPLVEEGASEPDSQALQASITLHDQKIGVIKIKRKEQNWHPREQAMLEEIATQVGLALENARLLEETQARAQRDQMVAAVSTRMRATLDLETILQTAARELQRGLNLKEAEVRLGLPIQEQASANERKG